MSDKKGRKSSTGAEDPHAETNKLLKELIHVSRKQQATLEKLQQEGEEFRKDLR